MFKSKDFRRPSTNTFWRNSFHFGGLEISVGSASRGMLGFSKILERYFLPRFSEWKLEPSLRVVPDFLTRDEPWAMGHWWEPNRVIPPQGGNYFWVDRVVFQKVILVLKGLNFEGICRGPSQVCLESFQISSCKKKHGNITCHHGFYVTFLCCLPWFRAGVEINTS